MAKHTCAYVRTFTHTLALAMTIDMLLRGVDVWRTSSSNTNKKKCDDMSDKI